MKIDFKETHEAIFSHLEKIVEIDGCEKVNIDRPNLGESKSPRIVVQVNDGECIPIAVGGSRYQLTGVLSMQIFIESSRSEMPAMHIIDALVSLFCNQEVAGCYFAGIEVQGRSTDSKSYQVNVAFPFHKTIFA